MFLRVPRFRAGALLMLVGLRPLAAEERLPVGVSRMGLSGIVRVPVVAASGPRMTAALNAGYGLTESQASEGMHHRFSGTLGLGWVPLTGVEFAAHYGARHDRHPNDAMGSDTGTLGDFAFLARCGAAVSASWRFGLDLASYFPGSEKPADSVAHPTIDTRGLWGWIPDPKIRLAGYAGFRWDNTAGVGKNASQYRVGDRLALGLSDYNAMLVGLGVAVPVNDVELLGETSLDLLVGSGAPSPLRSPIRLDLGLRVPLSKVLQAEIVTEFGLSSRPQVLPNSPLVPIEPRFALAIGLRYRILEPQAATTPNDGLQVPVSPAVPAPVARPSAPAPPLQPAANPPATPPVNGTPIVVTVVDYAGHPLGDAAVELHDETGAHRLEFRSGSTFVLDGAPSGRGRLFVKADLMQDWSKEIEIVPGEPLSFRVEMVVGENAGQIRGTVRAFDGKPLVAQVTIEPGHHKAHASEDGTFAVDLAPGKYRVKIALDGYQTQVREIEIGKNGVAVLNVDMKKDR